MVASTGTCTIGHPQNAAPRRSPLAFRVVVIWTPPRGAPARPRRHYGWLACRSGAIVVSPGHTVHSSTRHSLAAPTLPERHAGSASSLPTAWPCSPCERTLISTAPGVCGPGAALRPPVRGGRGDLLGLALRGRWGGGSGCGHA